MITIKDVANRCNVSQSTVSKALNDSKELNEDTKKYICSIASEMGYIPNANAKFLKKKKTYSIGILFVDESQSGLRHEYFSNILDSLKVEAESRGYDVTFINSNLKHRNMSYLDDAHYRNLDGVVIASVDFHNQEVIDLVNSDVPTVTIDYVYNCSSAVLSNNTEGMEDMVDYIISKGHKRIAFIHGEKTDVTNKRLAGFYKSCEKNNVKVDDSFIFEGTYHSPKKSGQITKEILARDLKPTCIIYPDDISMLGGITALTQRGYRIPEDISVVGYDGIAISRYMRPMFTTYVQNSDELGKQAVSNLIERIENPSTFVPKIIKVNGGIQHGDTLKDLNAV